MVQRRGCLETRDPELGRSPQRGDRISPPLLRTQEGLKSGSNGKVVYNDIKAIYGVSPGGFTL